MTDELVYHYTGAAGLKGIIDSECLWMTDIDFLNDMKEGVELDELIRSIIDGGSSKYDDSELSWYIGDRLSTISDFMHAGVNIYSVSFSQKSDLLSQWRGYCPPEGGFSLGFDKKILAQGEIFNKKDGFECQYRADEFKCIYSKNEKIDMAISFIDRFIGLIPKGMSYDQGLRELDYSKEFFNISEDYFIAKVRVKNEHFQEEDELRAVAASSFNSLKRPKFRQNKNILIPYLELGFDPFFLKEIVIGPSANSDISKLSIRKYLDSFEGKKYDHVNIRFSDIPYRLL